MKNLLLLLTVLLIGTNGFGQKLTGDVFTTTIEDGA